VVFYVEGITNHVWAKIKVLRKILGPETEEVKSAIPYITQRVSS
jgi:hypothetical protein